MYNQTDKDYEDWLEKCMKCQHYTVRKNDIDEAYCRKRNGKCEFKPYKSRKKVK